MTSQPGVLSSSVWFIEKSVETYSVQLKVVGLFHGVSFVTVLSLNVYRILIPGECASISEVIG